MLRAVYACACVMCMCVRVSVLCGGRVRCAWGLCVVRGACACACLHERQCLIRTCGLVLSALIGDLVRLALHRDVVGEFIHTATVSVEANQ